MKKKKLSPTQSANKLLKMFADEQGISLEEYKKRRAIRKKQQEEYSKTHWVSWLTDAQKHLIATTTVEPFNYMGKPLSRENQLAVKNYIIFHPNYKVFKKNYDKQIPEIILRTLKSLNKEFEGTFLEEVGSIFGCNLHPIIFTY